MTRLEGKERATKYITDMEIRNENNKKRSVLRFIKKQLDRDKNDNEFDALYLENLVHYKRLLTDFSDDIELVKKEITLNYFPILKEERFHEYMQFLKLEVELKTREISELN